jgi:predicted PurR-regulated permease PerM
MNETAPKDGPAPPPPAPGESAPATPFYRQIHVVALGLLIFVLAIHLLQVFATILQQLLFAAFIAYLLHPLHYGLVKRGVNALLAGVLVLLGIAGSFAALGLILYANVLDFNDKLPVYRENLALLGESVLEDIPELRDTSVGRFLGAEPLAEEDADGLVQQVVHTFFGLMGNVVVVVVYLAFLVAERANIVRRVQAAFQPARAQRVQDVIARINASIHSYIRVKAIVSLQTGLLTWAVLLLFGVDYAVTWGVLAFLLNFIPYVGSWVAVGLPVALSLVQFQSVWWALAVLAVLVVIQQTVALYVEPRMAGRQLNLSPLVILLALAFWGSLWGITGMILAVPLVVVAVSVLENIDETRPIAVMLSNR